MKITRTFQIQRLEPPSNNQSSLFSFKHPKSPLTNKLTLTSQLKIKPDSPKSPKTTINFHHQPMTHLFGSGELDNLKPTSQKQPISVFNAYMEKKQTKSKVVTNNIKIEKSTKERHMSKIQDLKKKVEEFSLMKQRSKSREKAMSKSVSKGKSKSHNKPSKSPINKAKEMKNQDKIGSFVHKQKHFDNDKDRSKSKPKSKSKSKPKQKSKSQSISQSKPKSKSKQDQLEEDYILLPDEIMRVKNPEQIDQLLTEEKVISTTYSRKSKERTKKTRICQMEKYFYAFLQNEAYEQFMKHYNPIESLMFMINDLPKSEQLLLHSDLQKQIQEQQTTLNSDKSEKQFSIEDICRGAIEIIEQKHETAKFVIQSLHQKNQHSGKQQKLNEWKSSKFRQILAVKSFLSFNSRQVVLLKDIQEDDYLPRIANQLRAQLEQVMGKDEGLNSSRSYDHKEIPIQTIEPIATGIEDDELELIKRARQIRQAIKEAIAFRLAIQAGRLHRDVGSKQINTSINSINQYLSSLSRFVIQNYSEECLNNVKKCFGFNVATKLKSVRQGKYHLDLQGFQQVLSNRVFVEFQQEIVGIGQDQDEKQRKYYEHVHNKCLFDLFNLHLSTFRPFYRNGQPLPWKANSEFISSFFISENNLQDVLHNCIYNVLGEAQHLCGVIIPGNYLLSLLPDNMDIAENLLLESSCGEVVENMVVEKTMKLIHQQIKTNAKDYANDLVDTGLRLDICKKIEDLLFAEVLKEIQQPSQ